MASRKLFLDTSIVADMIDASRAGHDDALALLRISITNDCCLSISEDMLSTLFYISDDKAATLEFVKHVVLVDWEVFCFGSTVIQQSIDLSLGRNLDLEDALQCLCARENGCDVLVTNDKGFHDCGIAIVSVEEFLETHTNPL